MPYYRYTATRPSGGARVGQSVNGTIKAGSLAEANQLLVQQGLVVQHLADPSAQAPVASAPVAVMARPVAAAAPVISVPVDTRPVIRTVPGSNKDRMFLFLQLGGALQAGINPAQAFHEISRRVPGYYRPAVEALAAAAAEGADLGAVMARYPDLFPDDTIAMIRAGQEGGYLAEAATEISRQSESAHKFKRFFWWIHLVFWNAIIGIPGMIWASNSMLEMYDRMEKSVNSGQGPGLGEIGGAYLGMLIWPYGPMFLLLLAISWALWKYFGAARTRRLRHKIGLQVPVFGKRAWHENLRRFTWSLSRLSKAGFAPARAYAMAADTVPNLEMRDRLRHLGQNLGGAEKMSDIIGRSNLFPDEFVPVMATAEYTGDIPGAMDHLSRSSQGEFETAEGYAKLRSSIWGVLALVVTSGLMLAIFMYMWYHQLPAKVLEGLEP